MISDILPDTARLLKDSGLKSTSQRIAVYNAMRKLGHASVDDLCQTMKDDGCVFTVATIYNVLDSFVEKGLVARRFSSNNKMYFDVTTAPHCHLYDDRTDTITDYYDPVLERIVREYTKANHIDGYELTGVEIQLIGHKTDN